MSALPAESVLVMVDSLLHVAVGTATTPRVNLASAKRKGARSVPPKIGGAADHFVSKGSAAPAQRLVRAAGTGVRPTLVRGWRPTQWAHWGAT